MCRGTFLQQTQLVEDGLWLLAAAASGNSEARRVLLPGGAQPWQRLEPELHKLLGRARAGALQQASLMLFPAHLARRRFSAEAWQPHSSHARQASAKTRLHQGSETAGAGIWFHNQ